MGIDLEMQEILKVFFEETAENLTAMETGLLALDAGTDREAINTIFRAAHSVKGGAGTFGFMEISRFMHAVETLLDGMRNGERAATAEAVQLMLRAVDVARAMAECAQAGQPMPTEAAEALGTELERLVAHGEAPSAAAATGGDPTDVEPDATDRPGLRVRFLPHTSLFQTCNDPLRIFAQLAAIAAVKVRLHVDALPEWRELDPTSCHLAWTLDLGGGLAEAQVREVFDWVDANSTILYEDIEPPVPEAAVVDPGSLAAAAPGPVAPGTAATLPKLALDTASIRVSTGKVDALINLVGELVITNSMLAQFGDRLEPGRAEALRRGLATLSRNTRELQESVLKIRMLPISFSFNRFPRLVRDLARQLGKQVELRLAGEQTELDKIVLEKIGDPLVHLVRNALDHGIEAPAERIAAGKSAAGLIELSASHEGGNVIIEVRDDGAGLNTGRILAKATERGLVGADARPSDEEIHNLIFVAGFSTASEISDVSGRGVGMDVVRRNILDLGGHVQVSSAPGRGSLVRIRLPLTLAILEGQMLRVGREVYVVSLLSIVETVQPHRAQVNSLGTDGELFRHRDAYLPVLRLHEIFDIEPDDTDITRGLLVVVESDGQRAAILVDELMAQQQVVIKSLDANFRPVPGLAGATIHGDGAVALILDVPALIGGHVARATRRTGRAA